MTYTPRYPRRPRGRHGKTWPLLRPESPSALDDLDAEHALLDFAERDGQRLLLAARLYQRPDVLEQPLSELRVVSVDLPCALRGHDYQPVLAVHDAKEFVDRRVDDAVGDLVGLSACHVLPSTGGLGGEKLLTLIDQGYQLAAYVLDGCVHQRYLALIGRREFFPGGRQPAFQHLGGLGAASGEPAHQLVPGGRGQEHQARIRRRMLDLARAH